MLYRCRDCREIFDEEDATPVIEHFDDMYDRGVVAVTCHICPHCGSSDLEDEYDAVFLEESEE